MLASVLLHVIEAPGPVDLPHRWSRGQGSRNQVGDPVSLVDHIRDFDPAEVTSIERLSTRCRIEGRAIEVDTAAFIRQFYHRGVELVQVGVIVVQSLSHGNSKPRKWVAI